MIIYSEIPKENLIFGVNRPQQWWNEHPDYIIMRDKIIQDIRESGLKNPLSCVDLENNTFKVTVGNQRLSAINLMDKIKTIPCIISTKNIVNFKFDYEVVENLHKYFNGIKRVCLKHNIFQIVPDDVDQWDSDKRRDFNET